MTSTTRPRSLPRLLPALLLLALLATAVPVGVRPGGVRAVPIPQKITLLSQAGDMWTAAEVAQAGPTQLTHGHSGCPTLNSGGYCSSGAWPTISGARWVWRSQLSTAEEAVDGTPWLAIVRAISVPTDAVRVSGSIRIAAADRYQVLLNGVEIGAGTEADAIDRFALPLIADYNELEVRFRGDPMAGGTPETNPAGVIFRADVTYEVEGNDPQFTYQPELTSLTPTSATLAFGSELYAWGYVDYGLTTRLGRVSPRVTPPDPSRDHTVTLPNLAPNTRYYWRARLENRLGLTTSEQGWFRTPPADASARLVVTTTNTSGSKILPRACYDVFADAGGGALGARLAGYCDSLDAAPDDGQVVFPALAAGRYVLNQRISAPGYAIAPKRPFSIAAAQTLDLTVTNVSGGTQLTITTRSEEDTLRANICFAVYRMTGDVVGEIASYACDGNRNVTQMGNFRAGNYWLAQTAGPAGYVPIAGRVLTIPAGEEQYMLDLKIYPEGYRDNVEVQAVDADGGLIPGACFILFQGNDSQPVCDGADGADDGRTIFTNVGPGTYSMIEFRAPAGYVVGKRTTFTKVDNTLRRLRFTQAPGGVRATVTTRRGTTTESLPGACYAAYQRVSSTTSQLATYRCDASDGASDGVTRLDGLRAGTYAVVQITPPPGYRQTADKIVTVGTTGVGVLFRNSSREAGMGAATAPDGTPPEFVTPRPEAATPRPTGTPSRTATASPTPGTVGSPTATPSSTPSPTPTDVPTETPTLEPTATATATATATEAPNATPVADAGPDQTLIDTDAGGDEPVTLDASVSTDPESGALTYVWTITGTEMATGPAAVVTLPVGDHVVALTVTDAVGAMATDELRVRIAPAVEARTPSPPPTETTAPLAGSP